MKFSEWVKVNAGVLARVLLVLLCYTLAKWYPQAVIEHEAAVAIAEALGLGFILTPGLRAVKRRDDL